MTPYYQDDAVTIYHGDCLEWLGAMPGCFRVDAIVTDPPYGIGFSEYASHDDNRKTYKEQIIRRLFACEESVENGWMAVYQSATMASQWGDLFPINYRQWRLIAMPKTFTQVHPGQWPIAATDYVLLLKIGKPEWPTKGERVRDWFIQQTSDMSLRPKGHPCPRPLSGVKHVMTAACAPGGTVLDPFMGSGTTLRAAKDLGRQAIGIEIEEKYCEIAARRMQQEVLPL